MIPNDITSPIGKKTLIPIIFILFCSIALFYIVRLSLFTPAALTNDNYSLGYPFRILVSTSIQNRIFPLWDHWTHGGYPLHSLLGMAGFSPIIILLSLFGVYSTNTYTIEILIVIMLGFVGMYFWLSRFTSHLPALIIAACFSMSVPQLSQIQLNFESAASTAMLPWLAFGIASALQGKRYGIGIIAFAVWIASTEGYFGFNIITWQFIVAYCSLDWVIGNRHNLKKRDVFTKPLLVAGGFILGLLIVNYPILETFTHFGMGFDKIREVGFNPYAASANIFTAFTLVFPNKIWMFWSDPKYLSGTGIIYFGFFQLLFILYAAFGKKNMLRIWLLLLFAVISFCITLSAKYQPAVLLNAAVPFLNKIRWHGWDVTLAIFFLATVSCIGLQYFLEEKSVGKKWIAVSIFLCISIFIAIRQSGTMYVSPFTYLLYPQTYIFLVFLAVLLVSMKIPDTIYVVLGLLLIEIFVTSGNVSLMGNNLFYMGLNDADIKIREQAKQETNVFPVVSNERSDKDRHINAQYYTKQPSMYGYNPVSFPSIFQLMKTEEYPIVMKRLFYAVDKESMPLNKDAVHIKNIKLTPNAVEAHIDVLSERNDIVWSSPYVRFWKLSVGGLPTVTRQNRFGLTEFTLTKGKHFVRFVYTPPYFVPSIFLTLLSIGTSIYLVTRKSKDKIDTIRQRSKELYAKKRGK